LLTSVDQEGTQKGFDCDLVRAVSDAVTIPVIASGGMGGGADLGKVVRDGRADAVAVASVLHYGKMTVPDIRAAAREQRIPVREL
jgi:cyclase